MWCSYNNIICNNYLLFIYFIIIIRLLLVTLTVHCSSKFNISVNKIICLLRGALTISRTNVRQPLGKILRLLTFRYLSLVKIIQKCQLSPVSALLSLAPGWLRCLHGVERRAAAAAHSSPPILRVQHAWMLNHVESALERSICCRSARLIVRAPQGAVGHHSDLYVTVICSESS